MSIISCNCLSILVWCLLITTLNNFVMNRGKFTYHMFLFSLSCCIKKTLIWETVNGTLGSYFESCLLFAHVKITPCSHHWSRWDEIQYNQNVHHWHCKMGYFKVYDVLLSRTISRLTPVEPVHTSSGPRLVLFVASHERAQVTIINCVTPLSLYTLLLNGPPATGHPYKLKTIRVLVHALIKKY